MSYPSPSFEAKYCLLHALAEDAARRRHPLVFTNDCFDILHRGHVMHSTQP